MHHFLSGAVASCHSVALHVVSGLHRKLEPGAFFSSDASLELDRLTVENERLRELLKGRDQ